MTRLRASAARALARALGVLVLGALASGALDPRVASAQVAMHREVPRGEVTGLEMGIEGSLRATPGLPVRWWVTLYEVLRHRDLRPASGCSVRAMASTSRSEPIASVVTGGDGRAALALPMPDDLTISPHLVLEATCPRGVRRLFDVDLHLEARERLALVLDRAQIPPGGRALAIGRVIDRATGRGIPRVEVRVAVSQGGPLGAPREVTTDDVGLFVVPIETGAQGGTLSVSATTLHEHGPSASASLGVQLSGATATPSLLLRALAEPAVAAPGALVDLVVEVRAPDGSPVADALVTGPPRDPLPIGSPPDAQLPEIRTDARGVAHYPWRLERGLEAGALVTPATGFQVTSARHGSVTGTASVRVARRRAFVGVAVAGGALVPGAPARVLVRVVGPDGLPLAGRDVDLASATLGSVDGAAVARGRTDADGLLALEVARVGEPVVDDCGGSTSTEIVVGVGGEQTSTCVPVDPDAPLAISAPARLDPGASLRVALARTERGARLPVIVTALRRGEDGWEPAAQAIAGPAQREVTLELGDRGAGVIWIRARLAQPDGQAVRGASALTLFAPPASSIALHADRAGARVEGAGPADRVLVLGSDRRAGELAAALAGDDSSDATLEALSGLALEAELAIRAPLDQGASSILRGSTLVPQAMPEVPVSLGLLRDPWRARARFVRGRLGRLMLAVEQLVETRIPDGLGEVGAETPRGWVWNREMLAAAVAEGGIDDEGSASLDGTALDIDALVALDPSFTFDRVARRITRHRLWRVLRVLREVTHERNLDLPWARRGDPRTWIASLAGQSTDDGETLETGDLFDAWGRAFVFRPSRRASFLPAIEGWEVASLGPDGRDGTADDLSDPFARVLPEGSLYAEAVGEDALVARLSGVALGRAFVATLDEQLGEGGWEEPYYGEAPATVGRLAEAWSALPPPLAPPAPLEVLAPLLAQPGGLVEASGAASERHLAWSLPGERRTVRGVAIALSPIGRPRAAEASFETGARLSLAVELPPVMRVGDRVRVPVVTSDPEALEAPSLEVVADGAGLVARLVPGAPRGDGTSVAALELEAVGVGAASLVVTARGADERRVVRRVRVLPGGALRAIHAGARVVGRGALASAAPEDARIVSSTLTLASPRALDRSAPFAAPDSPELAALVAWARALDGRLDPETAALAARVASAPGSPLADACALVALATGPEHAAAVHALRGRIGQSSTASLRERAAVLAALAGVVPAGLAEEHDPVAATVASLRTDGWRALATERGSPATMARVAAALLLADPEDGPGLALYRAARDALPQGAPGERALAGDPARLGDGWIGTLALAVAARQVGDDALADELASAASRELHLARRTGGEGAFWALAASVYGALGAGDALAGSATLEVGGERRTVALTEGASTFAVPAGAPVTIESATPVLASVESRFLRTLADERAAPFDVRIEGVLGESRSALEIVVEAGAADVAAPVVELGLPSLGQLDATAQAALARTPGVARVEEPDRGGVLRLHLSPLRAANTVRVPLVLRWLGAGRAEGLGIVAYDASSPTRITTHAARAIELASPASGTEAP
jgi:hypothetical protein